MAGFQIKLAMRCGNVIDEKLSQTTTFTHALRRRSVTIESLEKVITKAVQNVTTQPIVYVVRAEDDIDFYIYVTVDSRRLNKEGKFLKRVSTSYFLNYVLTLVEDTIINNF